LKRPYFGIEEFICQAFKFIQFYIFPFFIHSNKFNIKNLYQLMSFQPFDCLGALLLITLHLLSLMFWYLLIIYKYYYFYERDTINKKSLSKFFLSTPPSPIRCKGGSHHSKISFMYRKINTPISVHTM